MNQIIYIPKNRKNTKKLLTVFVIIMIVFGMTIGVDGAYNLIKNIPPKDNVVAIDEPDKNKNNEKDNDKPEPDPIDKPEPNQGDEPSDTTKPTISVVQENDVAIITAEDDNEISRVEYTLNDKKYLIKSDVATKTIVYHQNLEEGTNVLILVVYDLQENFTTLEKIFTYKK
jgi:hypothetical protein